MSRDAREIARGIAHRIFNALCVSDMFDEEIEECVQLIVDAIEQDRAEREGDGPCPGCGAIGSTHPADCPSLPSPPQEGQP